MGATLVPITCEGVWGDSIFLFWFFCFGNERGRYGLCYLFHVLNAASLLLIVFGSRFSRMANYVISV